MGFGFARAYENGAREAMNDFARRAWRGHGRDRRWRQSHHQHHAACAAAIDAEIAVAVTGEGGRLAGGIAMADDAVRVHRSAGRGLGAGEACDEARKRDHIGGRERNDAPP